MSVYEATDKITPDPHQPRNDFKDEVIEGYVHSLETLGQINPIEIDENNVILRHEQLWRAAKKLGLEKVLVVRKTGLSQARRFERQLADHDEDLSHIDKLWAYATGVVNINANADYTKEDIKKMYENDYDRLVSLLVEDPIKKAKHEPHGGKELSRRIGVPQKTISNYLAFFRAPETLRNTFLNGNIELAYLYRTAHLQSETKQEEIAKILVEDRVKPPEQRRFKTERELGDYVTSFNLELEKQATAKVEELKKSTEKPSTKTKQKPTPQPPKAEPSKEDVDAKAKEKADKPPKTKKTDREKAESSLNAVESKIETAETAGIDVADFTIRFKSAEDLIDSSPKEAWDQAKDLKKELDASLREAKQSEEQRKAIKEAEEKARKEAKEELMKDQEFLSQVVQTTLSPSSETSPRISLLDREIPVKLIDEIEVGEVDCPKCGATYRFIHCEPGRAHKIQRKA